uniref:Uncharacterized protein n=1 Tax=Anguilla anguilla TaxID=7936 RepID=A0A0E9QJA3_ANGAN
MRKETRIMCKVARKEGAGGKER